MNKRFVAFLLLCVSLVCAISVVEFFLSEQVRAHRFMVEPSKLQTRVVFKYLGIRGYLPWARSEEATIVNAAHYARTEIGSDWPQSLALNQAIDRLTVIFEKESVEPTWRTGAAYETLLLLTALPSDDHRTKLAQRAAAYLASEARRNANQATQDELFSVFQILMIHGAWSASDDVAMRVKSEETGDASNPPADRLRLAMIRSELARCLRPNANLRESPWDLLQSGFDRQWLLAESYEGWDRMRVQSVLAGSRNDDCVRFARRFSTVLP